MNMVAIAIIFGLVYPIYSIIAGTLMGSYYDRVKEAKAEWVEYHPVASIFGVIMGLAIPVAYWVLVITQLVL